MKTNQLLLGGGIIALIYFMYKRKGNGGQQMEVMEEVDEVEVPTPSGGGIGQTYPSPPFIPKGSPTIAPIGKTGLKPPRPTKPIVQTKPYKLPPIKPTKPTKPTTKPPLTKTYRSFSMGNINSELGI